MAKERKVTRGATIAQLGVYCVINRDGLTGKTFDQVSAIIRKQFNGQVVSDAELACIVERIVYALEKAIGMESGTLLSQQDAGSLSLLKAGVATKTESPVKEQ